MSFLECYNTQTERTHYIPLTQAITSLGSKTGNDVVLSSSDVSPHHANIVKRHETFTFNLIDQKRPIFINGRNFRSCPLQYGDKLEIGCFKLTLQSGNPPVDNRTEQKDLNNLKELVLFSTNLMEETDPNVVFSKLLTAVVNLTRAEKGFLIAFQDNQRKIASTHNVSPSSELGFSDTIIDKVVESKQALIINNAFNDKNYASAKSVVDLRLSSVLCVPLIIRKDLLGVIYLGNDSITGLFTEEDLRLLQIWATQASVLVHTALVLNELKTTNQDLLQQLTAQHTRKIIGSSTPMQVLFKHITKLAPTNLSVLVLGETGTGKELVAHELHDKSGRKDNPFISINCGAIPENLLESELFGHSKGAFTGASTDKIGKFEAANGGTIFLDEIGEMPMNLQVKLLRVLQERVIERVGEIEPRPIDIRIVSATNKNLEEEIRAGNFREDLYYRLNEVAFELPPLRDRGSDITELAKFFLHKYRQQYSSENKEFSPEAIESMRNYYWPGNVRQLESRIKKAVILSEQDSISAIDLGITDTPVRPLQSLEMATEEFKMEYVRQALELNNWNKAQTARILDVDPRTIFRYVDKLKDS